MATARGAKSWGMAALSPSSGALLAAFLLPLSISAQPRVLPELPQPLGQPREEQAQGFNSNVQLWPWHKEGFQLQGCRAGQLKPVQGGSCPAHIPTPW